MLHTMSEFVQNWKVGRQFRYCKENHIAKGKYGHVFAGLFTSAIPENYSEQKAAIKRVLLEELATRDLSQDGEMLALTKMEFHPSIVTLHWVEDDITFR